MKKRNMPQYQDFIAMVEVPDMPPEKKAIQQYVTIATILKIAAVLCLTTYILSVFLNVKIKAVLFILAGVMTGIYALYRMWFSKKMRDLLRKECDPIRFLARYTALISYSGSQNWELHFYNLATSLLYAGRAEDVEKVLTLFVKYCPDNLGRLYYQIISESLAAYKMDIVAMQEHCFLMAQFEKYVRLKGIMRSRYETMVRWWPALIQMYINGEYDRLYHNIKNSAPFVNSPMANVKKHYYLYKIALLLGDEAVATTHKEFVIQHGGKLWYRTSLYL